MAETPKCPNPRCPNSDVEVVGEGKMVGASEAEGPPEPTYHCRTCDAEWVNADTWRIRDAERRASGRD